jgi:hypothetical protein
MFYNEERRSGFLRNVVRLHIQEWNSYEIIILNVIINLNNFSYILFLFD